MSVCGQAILDVGLNCEVILSVYIFFHNLSRSLTLWCRCSTRANSMYPVILGVYTLVFIFLNLSRSLTLWCAVLKMQRERERERERERGGGGGGWRECGRGSVLKCNVKFEVRMVGKLFF